MKRYFVMRKLATFGGNHTAFMLDMKDTKEEADAAVKQLDQAIQELMPMELIRKLPNGNGEVLGIQVGKALADIGIAGIGHYVLEMEFQGRILTPPEKRIVLARN